MEHFSSDGLGYNKSEVNEFVDYVIKKTEENIYTIKSQLDEIKRLQEELDRYKSLESALLKANEDKKNLAEKEAELIVSEAKDNANRIINDALLKAEKAQNHADMLKRNTNVLKRRLRQIIENQLEVIEEMDRVDFDRYDDKY